MKSLALPALVALLSWNALAAAGPADLVKALERFKDSPPIAAKVELQSWSEKTLGKKPVVLQGSVTLNVEQSAAGLRTFLPYEPLERAAMESQRASSEPVPESSIRWLLKELDFGRLHHLLDQEEVLRGLIAGGVPTGEKSGTWEGQAVRVFEFTFKPHLSPEESYRLSHSEGTLVIRATAEGLPLHSEIKVGFGGRTSRMFGRYEGTKRTETRYRIEKEHLIAAERTVEEYVSKADGTEVTRSKKVYSVRAE